MTVESVLRNTYNPYAKYGSYELGKERLISIFHTDLDHLTYSIGSITAILD